MGADVLPGGPGCGSRTHGVVMAAGLGQACAAALGLLLCLGCGNEPQPAGEHSGAPPLDLRRPLVSFHPDPQVRVATRGEPQMQWLQVEGQPRRAFVCSQTCSLTFRAEGFRAGWLEVAAAAGAGAAAAARRKRDDGCCHNRLPRLLEAKQPVVDFRKKIEIPSTQ